MIAPAGVSYLSPRTGSSASSHEMPSQHEKISPRANLMASRAGSQDGGPPSAASEESTAMLPSAASRRKNYIIFEQNDEDTLI